jgi:hypothetical protein
MHRMFMAMPRSRLDSLRNSNTFEHANQLTEIELG